MKNICILLFSLFLLSTFNGCKKGNTTSISTNLIEGHWYIHHIYIRSYYSNSLIRDTTLHTLPEPNYIIFNSNGTLEYRFNEPSPEIGTYQLKGPDSVYAILGGTTYKWKIDLLISTNLNVQTTTYDYPLHGYSVETYQSFVK